MDAEAQEVAAQASAQAIRLIADVAKDNAASATFLLGDRYIHALHKVSDSDNSKIVLLPGDVISAVRSLVGGK